MSTLEFNTRPDFQRDRWGRPQIKIPGESKPKPYTRVSGYGQVLENQFGLTKWKMRTELLGALDRPDLLRLASAARGDDRRLDSIVEELLEAGGASRAANTGTAIHDVLAQLDAGLITIDRVPDEFRGHADAWHSCLEAHGLEVVPELVECHLVNDTYEAAGSGDNFLRRKTDGKLVAVDKKTGKSIGKHPIGYEVQLYLYATSHRYDVLTGERTSFGDVDLDVAYIAHIPAEGATCTLYQVDLRSAATLTELARQVRKAEKESTPVTAIAPVPQQLPLIEQRRRWIKDRLQVFIARYPDNKAFVARCWPTGVPTFKTDHAHNDGEIDLIAELLCKAETEVSAPFGATDPKILAEQAEERRAVALIKEVFPEARLVDDTSDITEQQYQEFKDTVEQLPEDQQTWISQRTLEASAAKKPLSLRQNRTVRRYECAQALMRLSDFRDDEGVVRAFLELAVPDANHTKPIGAIVGGLDLDQALRVKKIADAIDSGALLLTWDDTGKPGVIGDMSVIETD